MGVLDDAIREHLELKRRHGASEAEVSRKAEEALGPARIVEEMPDAEGLAEPPAPAGGEPDQGPTPEDDDAAPAPDEAPGEGDTSDEDVLEETPDFLQETPEHDRLWFEQKPPRGFNFDE